MSVHPCPAPKCRGVDSNAVLTDEPMCRHHAGKVGEALGEFPRLYGELTAAMLTMQTAGDDIRVATTSTRPLPINGDARAAQEDMAALLRRAEVAYRLHRGWSLTPRTREADMVVELARWTRSHLDGMLASNVAFGVRVLQLRHRLRVMFGEDGLVHRLGAPCPDCDAPLLTREDGASFVVCRGCGVAFPEDQYRHLARVLAQGLVEPPRPGHARLASGGEGFGW